MSTASDESGLSTVSLVVILISMALVLLLTLLGTGTFSTPSSGRGPSIVSNSTSEEQLKLCVEGRPSTYGNPPTPMQQAACTRQLAGQVAGGSGGADP